MIFKKFFISLFLFNLPLLFSLFLQNKQFQAIVGERISTPPGLIPIPRSSAPTDQAVRIYKKCSLSFKKIFLIFKLGGILN